MRRRFGGEVAIRLEGVRKSFRGHPVLRGVDLEILRGETFTILGGSGTGKSVCLKHMLGLLRPEAGRVEVLGTDMARARGEELVAVRCRCGMVFQGGALFDSLSVYENVAYPLREHRRLPEAEIAERVRACLQAVGLAGIEPLLPAELSGGMRKRVAVARAIALEPEVILYDEPTTGLDPANARRIGRLIRACQRELGVTSVVVTHDIELCLSVSDRVALLRGGRIVAEGPPEPLCRGDHPEVRAFLEGEGEEPEPQARVQPASGQGGSDGT